MAQRSVQPRTEQSANAANPQGTINGLARALNAYKVYRSKCRHTPRWLSSAKTGNLEFIQRRLREGPLRPLTVAPHEQYILTHALQ